MAGYVLSEAAIEKLRRTTDAEGRRVQNRPGRPAALPVDDGQAPEVYIVKATTGIAAFASSTPGSAECDVYRIATDGTLEGIENLVRTVYNLSTTALATNGIGLAVRDKFGQWFLTERSTLGGSGTNTITVTLHSSLGTIGDLDFTGTTKLSFEYDAGFAITAVSGTNALVTMADASATTRGTMGIVAQTFSGEKTFADKLFAQDGAEIDEFIRSSSIGVYTGTYAYLKQDLTSGQVRVGQWSSSGVSPSPTGTFLQFDIGSGSGSPPVCLLAADCPTGVGTTYDCRFMVERVTNTGAGYVWSSFGGATGTDVLGNDFVGGVVNGVATTLSGTTGNLLTIGGGGSLANASLSSLLQAAGGITGTL